MRIAFQDLYAPELSHCYGCGSNHPDGQYLKSYWSEDQQYTIAHVIPDSIYTGGIPDHLYGGMIASLLDCHGTASAAAFLARTMHFDFSQRLNTLPRCVTAGLQINFIQPTPLEATLELRGRLIEIEGRKIKVALSLSAHDMICANAEILAVQLVKPHH